jgi:peptidoglycan-N-acetylglucosamine deacetylase
LAEARRRLPLFAALALVALAATAQSAHGSPTTPTSGSAPPGHSSPDSATPPTSGSAPRGHSSPGSATPPTPGSAPPGHSTPTPPVRYRLAGCQSHGARPYLRGPARREVAIGFDDGPWPDTAAFVRMLERNHARATFFMIGEQVTARYRATLLQELRDGDVLGDHSFTHPDLAVSGGVRAQLADTLAAIRAQTGYTPCVFRPPYGDLDSSVVGIARSLGLATVLWDDDPSDYLLPGTSAIVQRVLAQVHRGAIIISHDGGGPRYQTLAAYPAIIAALHARGYRIVTIPELLGFRARYVPCIRLCRGIGVPKSALPRNAIVERAR